MKVFLKTKKLYGITPKRSQDILLIGALLNSTITRFFVEFSCRQLTGAQAIADIDVVVVESLPIPNYLRINPKNKRRLITAFKNLLNGDASSIFTELGVTSPDEVSLDKVKPERRELDKIIMGDILGLTEEEQLEVYRAVIDLVKSRIERAKSVANGSHIGEGMDVELLTDNIIDRVKEGEKE